MTEKEIILFKQLCRLGKPLSQEELSENTTPEMLGYLFFNRMQGVAFHQLHANAVLKKVPREFRNALQTAYEHNIAYNADYGACLRYVSNLLKDCDCLYAMLKGAFLCSYYPKGCRTSNDIDLLVSQKDITKVSSLLTKAGFQQGRIENGVFVPALRRQIIASKMTRGETVPYIKAMDLPTMKYLEIDVNYSLDYKNSESDFVDTMLRRRRKIQQNENELYVLREDDFLIHLCVHLYKEATTYPWVCMHRDMTLYKYEDIYYMLSRMSYGDIAKTCNRAEELGLEKICAYAFLQAHELIGLEPYIVLWATMAMGNDREGLHTVVSPSDKKTFRYSQQDMVARFFDPHRELLLQEV